MLNRNRKEKRLAPQFCRQANGIPLPHHVHFMQSIKHMNEDLNDMERSAKAPFVSRFTFLSYPLYVYV